MTGSALNIIIKLLAVLLAVLLWFNVITEKQYEHELTLPITDIEFASALAPVSDLPDSLTIKVLAEGKRLLRSDWKHAGLRIKATRLSRGVNKLDLNLETVSLIRADNITLLDIPDVSPVTVRMDRIDSTLKPVASRLAVVPDDGYMIVSGRNAVSPRHVVTIGPRQSLNQIDSIYTEQKVFDEVREAVSATLVLENPRPRSIILRSDSVEVGVVVEKIRRKELKEIPIEARGGARPIVDPQHLTITVEGPESLIDSISAANISAVVTSFEMKQDGYVRPTVLLPENVTAVGMRPDSVRIIAAP